MGARTLKPHHSPFTCTSPFPLPADGEGREEQGTFLLFFCPFSWKHTPIELDVEHCWRVFCPRNSPSEILYVATDRKSFTNFYYICLRTLPSVSKCAHYVPQGYFTERKDSLRNASKKCTSNVSALSGCPPTQLAWVKTQQRSVILIYLFFPP